MAKTILIVDDKRNVQIFLKELLSDQGFRIVTADNGRDAIFVARHEKPDLILLDIMMPEMNGYEFIKLYRQEVNIPIILLTARIEDDDKVMGLDLGADDYITKPFNPRELISRVHAVLRRTIREDDTSNVIRFEDIVLDRSAYRVSIANQDIALTLSEFTLLETLIEAPGRAFSRSELLDILNSDEHRVGRTVDVHISNLRAKIEPNPNQPYYIETVFGVGYRFRPEN